MDEYATENVNEDQEDKNSHDESVDDADLENDKQKEDNLSDNSMFGLKNGFEENDDEFDKKGFKNCANSQKYRPQRYHHHHHNPHSISHSQRHLMNQMNYHHNHGFTQHTYPSDCNNLDSSFRRQSPQFCQTTTSQTPYLLNTSNPCSQFHEEFGGPRSTIQTYQSNKKGIHFATKVQQFEYEPELPKVNSSLHLKNGILTKTNKIYHKTKLSKNSILSKNTRISINASKPIVISLESDPRKKMNFCNALLFTIRKKTGPNFLMGIVFIFLLVVLLTSCWAISYVIANYIVYLL